LFGLGRSRRSNVGTNAADETVHVTALYAVFCVMGFDTCNLRVDLGREGRIWTNKVPAATPTPVLIAFCCDAVLPRK
jgi:hypothetical protein